MVKILNPLGGASASGSIGGTTYSRNRYGAYARNRAIPVNPASGRQNVVRNAMSDLTSAWQNVLSSAQRTAWDLYAAETPVTDVFGSPITMTGLYQYVRSNVAILQAGLSRVDDGPTTFGLPTTDPVFAVAASEASNEVTVTFDDALDWCDEDGAALLLSVGRPQKPTINYFGGPWRFAGSIDGDSGTPPTSSAAVAAPWVMTEDQLIYCRARIVLADGRLSTFFRASAVCGA